jgi:hypothetical protein
MPAPPLDEDEVMALLDKSLVQRNWEAVAALATEIGKADSSATLTELRLRIERLERALIRVRAARANLALRLGQARAAAGFSLSHGPHVRQETGGTP